MRYAFLSPVAAIALVSAAQAQTVSSTTAAAVVQQTEKLLKENYLHPEQIPAIMARLNASLKSGRYSGVDPRVVATRMTDDIQEVTHDGHMNVNYDPDRAKVLLAPRSGPQQPSKDFLRKMLNSTNFGITEMKVLPGNIRYVNVTTFQWDDERSPAAFDEAARFLNGGDAYILDIRTNGGGDPEAVNYLVSHFMEPGKPLMRFVSARGTMTTETLKDLPGGRLPQKPLYLLTSHYSFSAAEEFAAHIKNYHLGTIVGETTGGGGNNNAFFGTPEGFVISISFGRAEHAVTGKSWQGEGIAPDIQAPAPAALDAAYLDALNKLRSSATGQDQARLDWTIRGVDAKLHPAPVDAARLGDYVGNYSGGRTVRLVDGKLRWRVAGGPELELVPMGGELFAVSEATAPTRIQFERGPAGVTGATILKANGAPEKLTRAPS